MFHSAGYFRAVRCPFFEHGLCHRPHCHFKHSKPGPPKPPPAKPPLIRKLPRLQPPPTEQAPVSAVPAKPAEPVEESSLAPAEDEVVAMETIVSSEVEVKTVSDVAEAVEQVTNYFGSGADQSKQHLASDTSAEGGVGGGPKKEEEASVSSGEGSSTAIGQLSHEIIGRLAGEIAEQLAGGKGEMSSGPDVVVVPSYAPEVCSVTESSTYGHSDTRTKEPAAAAGGDASLSTSPREADTKVSGLEGMLVTDQEIFGGDMGESVDEDTAAAKGDIHSDSDHGDGDFGDIDYGLDDGDCGDGDHGGGGGSQPLTADMMMEEFRKITSMDDSESAAPAWKRTLPEEKTEFDLPVKRRRIAHPQAEVIKTRGPVRITPKAKTVESNFSSLIDKDDIHIGKKRIANKPATSAVKRPRLAPEANARIATQVRQKYLDAFINEHMRMAVPPEEAYQKALAEEKELHEANKTNRNSYLNKSHKALKELKATAEDYVKEQRRRSNERVEKLKQSTAEPLAQLMKGGKDVRTKGKAKLTVTSSEGEGGKRISSHSTTRQEFTAGSESGKSSAALVRPVAVKIGKTNVSLQRTKEDAGKQRVINVKGDSGAQRVKEDAGKQRVKQDIGRQMVRDDVEKQRIAKVDAEKQIKDARKQRVKERKDAIRKQRDKSSIVGIGDGHTDTKIGSVGVKVKPNDLEGINEASNTKPIKSLQFYGSKQGQSADRAKKDEVKVKTSLSLKKKLRVRSSHELTAHSSKTEKSAKSSDNSADFETAAKLKKKVYLQRLSDSPPPPPALRHGLSPQISTHYSAVLSNSASSGDSVIIVSPSPPHNTSTTSHRPASKSPSTKVKTSSPLLTKSKSSSANQSTAISSLVGSDMDMDMADMVLAELTSELFGSSDSEDSVIMLSASPTPRGHPEVRTHDVPEDKGVEGGIVRMRTPSPSTPTSSIGGWSSEEEVDRTGGVSFETALTSLDSQGGGGSKERKQQLQKRKKSSALKSKSTVLGDIYSLDEQQATSSLPSVLLNKVPHIRLVRASVTNSSSSNSSNHSEQSASSDSDEETFEPLESHAPTEEVHSHAPIEEVRSHTPTEEVHSHATEETPIKELKSHTSATKEFERGVAHQASKKSKGKKVVPKLTGTQKKGVQRRRSSSSSSVTEHLPCGPYISLSKTPAQPKKKTLSPGKLKKLSSYVAKPLTSASASSAAPSKGRRTSPNFTILKKRQVPTLTSELFYSQMWTYVLSEDQLYSCGYPRPTSDPGVAQICRDGETIPKIEAVGPNAMRHECCRCHKPFIIYNNGQYQSIESCSYHYGKVFKFKEYGEGVVSKYNCCQERSGSPGCQLAKLHVTAGEAKTSEQGYVETRAHCTAETGPNDEVVYALDCEMCYTTMGLELARVSVIDMSLEPVYETLVQPSHTIVDYNTRFSGLTAKNFVGVDHKTLSQVQDDLLQLFSDRTILLGHSLESDLRSLKIIHSRVVDTAIVFPHKMGLPYKKALRTLAKDILHKFIQNNVDDGHDSLEDSRACMELMIWKVKGDLKAMCRGRLPS